jgi:hypothetical protein
MIKQACAYSVCAERRSVIPHSQMTVMKHNYIA